MQIEIKNSKVEPFRALLNSEVALFGMLSTEKSGRIQGI
jgi:hypothetical protein